MPTHLRQAYRSLRRSPGASLISLGVLALGIGAATALFSLYNNLVLRPLPVQGGNRMAALMLDYGKSALPRGLCLEERQALGPLGGPVEALVLEEFQVVRVQAEDLQASLKAVLTSPDYFPTLGVRTRLGAGYRAQEPGVVISSALWRTAFGAAASLEGRGLRINGAWLPVVGIAPPDFHGLKPAQAPDLWLPADAIRLWNAVEQQAFTERGAGTLHAFVRLSPGATCRQGEAFLQPRVQDWRLPNRSEAPLARLTPLTELRQETWQVFLPQGALLWVSVGLLLVLACLNVAQLQAARAFRRRREEATRLALGGAPLHLLAGTAVELLLLVVTGTVLALPVAALLAWGLSRIAPASMEVLQAEAQLDLRVLAFALGLLLLMALGLLAAAAWRLTRLQPMDGLRAGLGGTGRLGATHRILLGVQLALAVALLWNAGSVLQGLHQTLKRPLGLDLRQVYVLTLQVPNGTPKAERAMKLGELRRRIAALPGIDSAAVSASSPLDPLTLRYSITDGQGREQAFLANLVSRDYFKTLRIPLLEGREFAEPGAEGTAQPVILSRSQARLCFPGMATVTGRQLSGMEVVGVVEDHVQTDLRIQPRAFLPMESVGFNWQCLLVRSPLPAGVLLPRLDREVAAVDPRWPLLKAEPLNAKLLRQQRPQRLASALLGGLGTLAGVLAFVGIFGLQSQLTAQRTREAGLRIALGATPASVARTFTGAVLAPALIGLAGGLVLVRVGRGLLDNLLGGLGTVTWPSLLATATALLAAALTAAWLPALRAAQRESASTLRSE